MRSGPDGIDEILVRAAALRRRANDQRGEVAALAERFSKLERRRAPIVTPS